MAGDTSSSKDQEIQQQRLATLPKELPATFLKKITNDFSPDLVLGCSVFGKIYKGILPDEGGIIAVKKLAENSQMPVKTFDTEVTNLMVLRHKNIVELVGYCHEGKKDVVNHNGRYVIVDIMENFLCYKHLPNGSLDKYLHVEESSKLDWDKRFKIIKGMCEGLHFLHKKPDGPLIHMNIVPTSIWLDDEWVPKIADFGLSRLFGQEQTRMNTINVMGQNGYMAPEYLYRGEISTMSDIYSLGMLIIEITTGEKNYSNPEDRSARKFVDKVHENWTKEYHITSKYTSLNTKGLQEVKLCIDIGLSCVEVDRSKRPSIEYIVDKLSGK
ncbi:hypothetical protein EJB05_53906, partial [Eragrostis curvula]